MNLNESVPKCPRQRFPSPVRARRVLRRKQSEVRVRFHGLLSLRYVELPVVVEEPIECLENLRRCEVQLVEDDPVPVPQRRNENTLLEHELREK